MSVNSGSPFRGDINERNIEKIKAIILSTFEHCYLVTTDLHIMQSLNWSLDEIMHCGAFPPILFGGWL